MNTFTLITGMRNRCPLICPVGHHVWTLPCMHCRARKDRQVNAYFRELSKEILRDTDRGQQ